MSKAKEVKLHIKVAINKEKTKVLYAEAGSDFTDVLLSFLLLPLGKIVEVLEKHYKDDAPLVGSLNSLYKGVADLDIIHFHSAASKQNLLSVTSCYESELRELRLKLDCNKPSRSSYEKLYDEIFTQESCNESESYKLRLKLNCTKPSTSRSSDEKLYDGVFTRGEASFIISDDLRLIPNVAGSFMETLSTLGIVVAEMDCAETRDMTFGLNEIMALLKESLVSLNPMTALVFPHSRKFLSREGGILKHEIDKKLTAVNYKKMNLKVLLQKSTEKLVFAQADYDFLSFLFGLLIIPLGKVEWFLESKTGLKSIDNLHRSVADNSENMQLKNSETRDLLVKSIDPKNITPTDFYDLNFACDVVSRRRCLVKDARMYMVRDDLTAAPLGITSGLSVINELKISLSDVGELELQVGLKEGLSIVKAALTSNTALTDGLIEPMLKERAHQLKKWSKKIIGVGEVMSPSKKRSKPEC